MIRGFLFLVIFSVLPVTVLAADIAQTVDIPASESPEDVVSEPGAASQPITELQKRREAKPTIQAVTGDKPAAPTENQEENNTLILQGLNKVIGRVSTLEILIGTLGRFENLEIIPRKCWKSPPEEQPENAALLEIREVKTDEAPKQIFLGWMLSSSPAISSLEHPVYDITVLSCEYRKNLETN